MTSVGLVIPMFDLGRDKHRMRAFVHTQRHLRALGWPLALGVGLTPGAARNEGARLGRPAVYVFNDADTMVPLEQIESAVARALTAPGLVFAFTQYGRLGREDTEGVAHHSHVWTLTPEEEFDSPPSHGCVAISRECFAEAGRYDERIEVFEDIALTARCEALWPGRRVEGRALHLWHPRIGEVGEPAWESRYAGSREIWEAEYPSVVVPHG